MRCLRFRVPGDGLSVRALVERADPTASREGVQACIAAGRLRVAVIPSEGGSWQPGGAALRSADTRVAPGTALCLTESSDACATASPFLAQGADETGGPGEWRVLAETLPWPQGVLRGEGRAAADLGFERLEERDGVALYDLRGDVPLVSLRARMAAVSAPILGDVLHGGRLIAGGLRVASDGGALPGAFWPSEAVLPTGEVELPVSAGTLRALRRGHPWILRDSETGDTGRGRAGGVVRLRGRRGREDGGLARVDGAGSLAARVWAPAGGQARDIEARVDAALARRAGLLGRGGRRTTAFRLVHGEADGLPGLSVDRLGALLRVVVGSACGEAVRVRVVACLLERLHTLLGDGASVVTLAHQRKPPGGVLRRATGVWLDQGALAPDARPVVLEHGLRFSIDPGLGEPGRPRPGIGLFLDQRENRRRVAGMVSGGRYLNLFAHTGAFSAALLRAGAEHVTSVDLSAPYLAWTERNLRLNDLEGERHRAVRGDARRHLAECPREARFAGIILDPPTAAAAGRRFFSVKRDLLPMLEEALARLEPGGWLLVSRNDRARRGDLVEVVRRAARAGGVGLADVSRAPSGPDFPQLRGFPEGDPMQAVLARVR